MKLARFSVRILATWLVLEFAGRRCLADDVTMIGRVSISPTATDLSGQADAQENGTPQNRLGGHGSAIAWMGGKKFVMLPDRGPDDGATSYRCRIQIVEIDVQPGATNPLTSRLLETHFLTNADGKNFVGRASQFDQDQPEKSLRLDPEGIRVTSRGTFLIAEEYGPAISEFDAKGKWLRDLPIPSRYRIVNLAAEPSDELPPHNVSGRQNNRGWEGVAIGADGQKAYAILQNPLIQDGGLDEKNVRVGTNVRLLELDLNGGHSREFLYVLDDNSFGCSDIEWIESDRFLVIERDGAPGSKSKAKRLYEISLNDATDLSAIERLPKSGVPEGVRPVSKKLYLDLLDPKQGIAIATLPEKIEGIAFGAKLADGSRLLIVTSDNDFKGDQPTEIFAFATR